jgi:cobalt/nickel transport system permease protein
MTALRVGVVGESRFHALDPRAKLLGLLGITVIAVSASAWPVFAACAAAQATIAVAARVPARTIVSRGRVVLPLLLLLALFLPFSDPQQIATVAAKALLGTLSAVLLGATTSFPDVLHALERLKVPPLPILIAAFMYRYLFTIVEEVQRMKAALAARGYAPRTALQAAAIGRVATALFLRTYERAERVHLAMLARGWRQTMPRLDTLAFTRADGLFLAALATPLLVTRALA